MDFEVSDKIKVITGMIDEFLDKEIIPLEPEFLTKTFREMLPVIEEKRSMVKKMELWAPNHPKEYGGMGLNLMEHAFVSESLGRSPLVILPSAAKHRMPATSRSSIFTGPPNRNRPI